MATTDSSTDVRTWLQSLNLGEYADVFKCNGYSQVCHCTSLTEDDLNLLGIKQTGYKKRILSSLSNMNVGKPSLPPRTKVPQNAKPVPPARKPPRPPSLDNDEYFKLPTSAGVKSPLGVEKASQKPKIVPRESINYKSNRPELPPRDRIQRPKPSPRKTVGTNVSSHSHAEMAQVDANVTAPTLSSVPLVSPPLEDDLVLRPLPPVPGINSDAELSRTMPELSGLSPKSETLDDSLPPLPARPPVIGAEDPPAAPHSSSSSSPSAPVMHSNGDIPPPERPTSSPSLPSSEPGESLPPPLPSRPSEYQAVVHPTSRPDDTDHHTTPQPSLPQMELHEQVGLPPPPPPRASASESAPVKPIRPAVPGAASSSSVPPVPVRPSVPYVPDGSSSSESETDDFDQQYLLNRPVPLPPLKTDSSIQGEYDVDRPVPMPPVQLSKAPQNEYFDLDGLPQNDDEDDEQSQASDTSLSGTPSSLPSMSVKENLSDNALAQEDQNRLAYEMLISSKAADPDQSLYDTPNPPMGMTTAPAPPPRRADEESSDAQRESIYDSPSSNQRASDIRSSFTGKDISRPPPDNIGSHMFTNSSSTPSMSTNVSSNAVSSGRNSEYDEFHPRNKEVDYLHLSDASSGQHSSQEADALHLATQHENPPIPPPRTEEYILLSESSTGEKDDVNGSPPLVHRDENKLPDNVTYSSPSKSKASPMKPGRPAPPPPPVRKSSLSSNSSPVRRMPSYTDPVDDTYHLVDPDETLESTLQGSPSRELESEESEEEEEDDDVDYSTSSIEDQRLKDFHRISNCSMGQGDPLQRQQFLRQSTREMRRSMHQRTLQKVSETYQQLPQNIREGHDSGLEKSGHLYLYSQSGSQANRGYKKRFIVFRNGELRYYANEKELNVSKGIVPVGTMRDVKYNTSSGSKEKAHKLDLYTNGRTLNFSTDKLDDCIKWASTLMQAILSYNLPPGGFPMGGVMSSPDKQGHLKFEGVSAKRYVAVKGEMLYMYKSKKDFDAAVAICDIEMKLANVKEVQRNRLQLTTPSSMYILSADSQIETSQWQSAFQEAIQEGLSSRQFLDVVYQNKSNSHCAECTAKDPDWASINLGIVICKACSGCHRNLGVHISKVRSLKMDERVWTDELLGMMVTIGNQNSNAFWEANLNEDDEMKLHPGDTFEDRQLFIEAKYKEMKYCDKVEVEKSFLNRSLHIAVENGNLRECLRLLFSGADPQFKNESGKTALDIAQAKQQSYIHELLKQNCDVAEQKQSLAQKMQSRLPQPELEPPKETSQESIKLSGYLYKTGSNRKDFQKRYCVLEHGVFKYYADEKAQVPKNQIEGSEMILIAVAGPRPNHQFCFDICASTGRAYLFAADSVEERSRWMVAIARCQTLDCMWNRLKGYEVAGFLKKKEGAASTQWQRLWFILHGKFMYFYSAIKNSEDYIDLRKLKSISVDESDSEEQKKISFVMPKKNLYFTAETDQARELWYQQFEAAFRSAGPSLDDQPLSDEDVPLIITACINFVEDKEGLETEGIYRKSGSASAIKRITSLFLEDPRSVPQALKEGEYDVHDVTSSLKKYFRELPEPLLTKNLYQEWIGAAVEDHQSKLFRYKDLLEALPHINYAILKDLLCHLKKVLDNKEKTCMNESNLGTVFGPTLMASSDPLSTNFQNAEKEINVILELITYYDWLFDIKTNTLTRDKEQKIQAAKHLLNNINNQPVDAGFIVEIFNGRKPQKGDGSSFSIKISDTTTARELIQKSIEQGKVEYKPNLAVFEIVSKGSLERLLHSYEYVLQDIMGWNAEFGSDADNYICIMEDYLTPRVELYMKVLSSSDFVKFQEQKKNFKKMYFELNQNVLNAYKDRHAPSMLYQWKVSEMKIYLGHDRRRSPPTQHCLAFAIRKEQGLRHLSFETEEALNTWLGAFFKSKKLLAPPDDVYEDSMEQAALPIPPSSFNAPFTRPQELGKDPHNPLKRVTQITSHFKRWSRSPVNQNNAE